jgi:Domain of unknown function (DUF4430)
MRRPALLAILSLALLSAIGHGPVVERAQAADAAATKTVEMVVDYGDGVQIHYTALPLREKMTAFDAVTAASAHPHGVKFVWRGAGATAFVTQIGDVKNEGGGAKSRNWLFSIDGKESEVGVGDAVLKPGDVVLWRFGVLDNNGK